MDGVEFPPVQAADIARATRDDHQLAQVKKWIIEGWPEGAVPEDYRAFPIRQSELSLNGDCIVWDGPMYGACFLVLVDAFLNWAEVEIIPSLRSAAVIEKLRKMFASFGVPEMVLSDNGTAFVSAEMQRFLRGNGILSACATLSPND